MMSTTCLGCVVGSFPSVPIFDLCHYSSTAPSSSPPSVSLVSPIGNRLLSGDVLLDPEKRPPTLFRTSKPFLNHVLTTEDTSEDFQSSRYSVRWRTSSSQILVLFSDQIGLYDVFSSKLLGSVRLHPEYPRYALLFFPAASSSSSVSGSQSLTASDFVLSSAFRGSRYPRIQLWSLEKSSFGNKMHFFNLDPKVFPGPVRMDRFQSPSVKSSVFVRRDLFGTAVFRYDLDLLDRLETSQDSLVVSSPSSVYGIPEENASGFRVGIGGVAFDEESGQIATTKETEVVLFDLDTSQCTGQFPMGKDQSTTTRASCICCGTPERQFIIGTGDGLRVHDARKPNECLVSVPPPPFVREPISKIERIGPYTFAAMSSRFLMTFSTHKSSARPHVEVKPPFPPPRYLGTINADRERLGQLGRLSRVYRLEEEAMDFCLVLDEGEVFLNQERLAFALLDAPFFRGVCWRKFQIDEVLVEGPKWVFVVI